MAEKSGESLGTVLVAGAANLSIALAKLIAGLVGGSAAMLSEAAHSACTRSVTARSCRTSPRPTSCWASPS